MSQTASTLDKHSYMDRFPPSQSNEGHTRDMTPMESTHGAEFDIAASEMIRQSLNNTPQP